MTREEFEKLYLSLESQNWKEHCQKLWPPIEAALKCERERERARCVTTALSFVEGCNGTGQRDIDYDSFTATRIAKAIEDPKSPYPLFDDDGTHIKWEDTLLTFSFVQSSLKEREDKGWNAAMDEAVRICRDFNPTHKQLLQRGWMEMLIEKLKGTKR